jgi:ATP-dependent phosphoenolpyruvate carboxykinase
MKIIFRWCGMALAFGLSSVGATTLSLRFDPDRRMLLAGKDQEGLEMSKWLSRAVMESSRLI